MFMEKWSDFEWDGKKENQNYWRRILAERKDNI